MLRKLCKLALVILLAGIALPAMAQTKMGNNLPTIHPSALTEMESITQGFLPPRMLGSQIIAIPSPAVGLIIYCLDCVPKGLRTFDGTGWTGTNINPDATYISNTLSCNGSLTGTYIQGVSLFTGPNNTNYAKNITINSVTGGRYTATTDTINGLTFAGSGIIQNAGANTSVILYATGVGVIPAAGTFTYTVELGGQTCSFDVNFIPAANFSCNAATSTFTPGGPLVNGTSYSGTYTIPYTSSFGASLYNSSSITKNGLTLSRPGGFYSSSGNLVYTLSGTYTGVATSETFTLLEGCEVVIPSSGYVSTLAGNGTAGIADGTNSARFNLPHHVAVDGSGNVYVADYSSHRIRKITSAGVVSTLAGGGGAGFANGQGTAAQFNLPVGIAVDGSGNVYVADYGNHTIRKITPAGAVTTLAGSGTAGFANGTGTAAQFNNPQGVIVDGSGNVYVGDFSNHRIRKITPAGAVTTLAGSGTAGFANGTGTAAQFDGPQGVAVDGSGNVYVADYNNHRIRKVTPTGAVTSLAGSSTAGFTDGTGTAAQFDAPRGVTVDVSGNVYVTDFGNHSIRKVTPTGVVTSPAGNGIAGYADGILTDARFNGPVGITIDNSGNIYIGDVFNNRIRKMRP